MRRNLFAILSVIGIFTIFGAFSANAQSNFLGKYTYKSAIKENPINAYLEIKSDNTASLTTNTPENNYQTKIQNGSWSYDKAKKLLTITLSKDDQATEKETIYFKVVGKNLKYITPPNKEDIFGDFIKTSKK